MRKPQPTLQTPWFHLSWCEGIIAWVQQSHSLPLVDRNERSDWINCICFLYFTFPLPSSLIPQSVHYLYIYSFISSSILALTVLCSKLNRGADKIIEHHMKKHFEVTKSKFQRQLLRQVILIAISTMWQLDEFQRINPLHVTFSKQNETTYKENRSWTRGFKKGHFITW